MDDTPSPSVEALLTRLADSVRFGVIPRIEDDFVRAELFSLYSILKILAGNVSQLTLERNEELTRLTRALPDINHLAAMDNDGLREVLASRVGDKGAHKNELIREFNDADSVTGVAALVSPRAAPSVSSGVQTWGSLSNETDVLSRLLCGLLDAPAGSHVDYSWNTEGFAAETVTATIVSAKGDSRKVVIRAQWPERPLSALFLSPHDQLGLLNGLREHSDVTVPAVYGVLTESDGLGTDAIVMEFVDGDIPTNWTPSGRQLMQHLRDAGALDFYLKDLHALQAAPWRHFDVQAFHRQPDSISRYAEKIEVWAGAYHSARLRPDPLLEETIEILRSHDSSKDAEVLVHGDFRPGNTIYRSSGEQLSTCVIDWSDATIGDLHEDLGVAVMWAHRDDQGRAMGLAQSEALISSYRELSGVEIGVRQLLDAELLATFRRCVGFHLLARNWLDRGGDIRMARAWLALTEDRRHLNRLIKELERIS